METKFRYRDYSLVGPESVKAVESGLSCVQWYRCPIERQQLKELMKRRDMPALRDTALWFILIITAGAIAYVSWGSWFAVPAFLVYGWLYGGNFIFCNRCGPCSAFIRTAKNARHRNRSR